MPGEAMEPLEALGAERAVVRYDQLGCGRSDWPDDQSLWRIETFRDELRDLRRELDLQRLHLLGWSWGGSLALDYLLERPDGILSVCLASAPFSTALWIRETRRLRDALPEVACRTLDRCEPVVTPRASSGNQRRTPRIKPGLTTAHMAKRARGMSRVMPWLMRPAAWRLADLASRVPPLRAAAFEIASMPYLQRHVCRLDPFPPSVMRGLAGWNKEVYRTLWGPSEFLATGLLATWDVEARLGEIDVPALITSGRYDEATDEQMRRMRDGLANARWVRFEASAHIAFVEEADRYRQVLAGFLDEVEGR